MGVGRSHSAMGRDTDRPTADLLGLTLPTPVERLASLSTEKSTFYVKRDDQTHALYGGNKARKLAEIFARLPRSRKIATVGAAGSHHVLATALFGKRFGHVVEGILIPQPKTEHVVENLRAGMKIGLIVRPASSMLAAGMRLALAWLTGKTVIMVGGSNVPGALAYVEAMHELAKQVDAGLLPRPDAIVVTLGSGGTLAGIAVGAEELGWETKIVGVVVTNPPWAAGPLMRHLAGRVARSRGGTFRGETLVIERGYLGKGYGYETEKGKRAMAAAADVGVALDATYTAKTFAAATDLVATEAFSTVLYWHTLSSAPFAPLLEGAPDLPPALGKLLR